MPDEENPDDEFSGDDEDENNELEQALEQREKLSSLDQVIMEMERIDKLRRDKIKGQSASIQRLLDQGIINRIVNNPTSDGDVVVKAKLVHDIIGIWEMGELAPDTLGLGSKMQIGNLKQLQEARKVKESYCRTFDALLADRLWDYSYVVNRIERYRKYSVDVFIGEEMEQLNKMCKKYNIPEEHFEQLLAALSKKLHDAEPAMNNMIGFYLQDAESGRPRGRSWQQFAAQ